MKNRSTTAPVTLARVATAALAATMLMMVLPAFTAAAQEAAQQTGRVTGRIIGNPEKGSVKGATVVLLQFRLDEQGKPQGGPVGRMQAGEGGAFEFAGVAILPRAVYRLGTRIDGNLISSKVFSFPSKNPEVVMDLVIPEVTQDLSALTLAQGLVAMEPREGGVLVTEVLHLRNPAPNTLNATKKPLELSIPEGVQEFEMLRQDEVSSHERVGPTLLVFKNFPSGENTIAFRYRLGASLGGVSLTKTYPMNARMVTVLSPQGGLEVSGAGLTPGEPRNVDGQVYSVWSTGNHAAGAALVISAKGLPAEPWVFLALMGALLIVLAGVVAWFVFVRMKRGAAA